MTKKPITKAIIDHSSKQFQRGLKEELKEHPQLGKAGAAQLVEQHITLHPYMYKN